MAEGDEHPPSVSVSGDGAVEIVLPEMPDVRWTVRVRLVHGRAAITELHYVPRPDADPASVALDPVQVVRFSRRLTSIAATYLGLGRRRAVHRELAPDGDGWGDPDSLWTSLLPAPTRLGPKPHAGRYRDNPDEYERLMTEWTAPVADEVRAAAAEVRGIQSAVQVRFGVGQSRAEELIQYARDYHHDLPKQVRAKRTTTKRKAK